MSFQFWRNENADNNISWHLSKQGDNLAFGARGSKISTAHHGKRATLGIPGTGLFYTTPVSDRNRKLQPLDLQDMTALDNNFFSDLSVPDFESQFVLAVQALADDREEEALTYFGAAADFPDASFMCGTILLKHGNFSEAIKYLEQALQTPTAIGLQFHQYDILATTSLQLTSEITVVLKVNEIGCRALLAEAYQKNGQLQEALAQSHYLHSIDPTDAVLLLQYVELLSTTASSREAWQRIAQLTSDLPNDCDTHAALRLFLSRAQQQLGNKQIALKTLIDTLRKKKHRDPSILVELLYERGRLFEETKMMAKAAGDYQRILELRGDYADVSQRLAGLKKK
jgi:tetratricopeptide (TPR) repeat protein